MDNQIKHGLKILTPNNKVVPPSVMGYLEKESKHLKIFRKRYIVIRMKDNKLYSYKSNNTNSKPTEIINLANCREIYKRWCSWSVT